MKRKFYSDCFYHVFNRSIANFRIFNKKENKQRFLELIDYYNQIGPLTKYSIALKLNKYQYVNCLYPKKNALVKIVSFCIMPDHYHLLLKSLKEEALSKYISDIENSFTRYFNLKFKRKGPLWESRFKAKIIKNNEALLHVLRYIHLNPVTSGLVEKPEDWGYSSYRYYLSDKKILSEYNQEISIVKLKDFKKFHLDQKDYQRKLKQIKNLIFDQI